MVGANVRRRPLVYPALMLCLLIIYGIQQRKERLISQPVVAEPSRHGSWFQIRQLLSKNAAKDENPPAAEGNSADDQTITEAADAPTSKEDNSDHLPNSDSIPADDDETKTPPTDAPQEPAHSPATPSDKHEVEDHHSTTHKISSATNSFTNFPATLLTDDEDEDVVVARRRMIHKPYVWSDDNATCLEPAYLEFPPDLFTNAQRERGAVIVHLLVGFYMFYALAVVCDGYFVTSLERICEKIGLSEDVAGATFMAAGSSAPELFASLLGVFVAKGDVGTGTIVGSAVFNILFVVGICGIFAGQSVLLSWWPLLRDSIFYAFTVIVLIIVMADGVVKAGETVVMLLLYLVYILIMHFNLRLRSWLNQNTLLRSMDEFTQASRGILENDITGKVQTTSYVQFSNDTNQDCMDSTYQSVLPADERIRDYQKRMSLFEAVLLMLMTKYFRPKTRFWSAAKRIILEIRRTNKSNIVLQPWAEDDDFGDLRHECEVKESMMETDNWKHIPSLADGVPSIMKWFVTVPVQATLYYTIPNCNKPRWDKWFLLTFSNSMLWIAIFSYILVWMVTLVGYTFGIPDSVMGITFLAAGTSVPDAISSLIVAKQGQGDMAVSNSIGSNVFDILIGLALPWFLQTVVVMPGTNVYINSRGMVYNVILLFLSIAATITAVHKNNWQLNQRLGFVLLSVYVVFLIFSILIECNVFGLVNPPECEK